MALAQLGYMCAPAPGLAALFRPNLRDEEMVWCGAIGLVFAIITIIGNTQARTWTKREAWLVFGITVCLLSMLLFGLFGWQAAVIPAALVVIGALLWWSADQQSRCSPTDDYMPPYYWL